LQDALRKKEKSEEVRDMWEIMRGAVEYGIIYRICRKLFLNVKANI